MLAASDFYLFVYLFDVRGCSLYEWVGVLAVLALLLIVCLRFRRLLLQLRMLGSLMTSGKLIRGVRCACSQRCWAAIRSARAWV